MAIGGVPITRVDDAASAAHTRLKATSKELAIRRFGVVSGNRPERAEDDTAGFSISSKLRAKIAGQRRAHSNAADARGMLTTANNSLGIITELLGAMKQKSIQAGNDTLAADERTLIQNQINSLSAEIGDVLRKTEFNGRSLFDSAMFNFQVGDSSQGSLAVTVGTLSIAQLGVEEAALGVLDTGAAATTLAAIDAAMIAIIGRADSNIASQSRLSVRQVVLLSDIASSERALSQISDADLAKEALGIAQTEAMQQTAASATKADSGLGEMYL